MDLSHSYMLDIVDDLFKSSEDTMPVVCSICNKECDEEEVRLIASDEGEIGTCNIICSTCVSYLNA